MKVVILQSNYLPWRGYFDLIHDADSFVFYDEVQYTKRDWRNRNVIYPKTGLLWLTVPVEGKAITKRISEVEIAGDHWLGSHLKSLRVGYGGAAHFHQLEPLLEECYAARKWSKLADFNHVSIKRICSMLGIRTALVDSSSLDLSGDRVARLVNICRQLKATEYISGPAAEGYLEGQEHLFAEHNIKLTFKDYAGYPAYKQLREPYEPRVSIVDLIANVALESVPELIWGWRGAPAHP